jgi:hypothetical protein
MHRCGPERPVHGEVLTKADGDDIGSLQGVAWRPAARCQGTTRGGSGDACRGGFSAATTASGAAERVRAGKGRGV